MLGNASVGWMTHQPDYGTLSAWQTRKTADMWKNKRRKREKLKDSLACVLIDHIFELLNVPSHNPGR
jgi:hypothetical protein